MNTTDPRDVVTTIKLPAARTIADLAAAARRRFESAEELATAARATWIAAIEAPAAEFDPAAVDAASQALTFAQGRAAGLRMAAEELQAAAEGY